MSGFDRVVFVYGASGVVGQAYLDGFASDKNTYCYGLTRNQNPPLNSENVKFSPLGVGSYWDITRSNQSILLSNPGALPLDPASKIREVAMIYVVGPSKFEPPEDVKEDVDWRGMRRNRGMSLNIDQEIYRLNLRSVVDLTRGLMRVAREQAIKEKAPIHVKLVCFASIADKHNPAFWQSYTRSKNILRRYVRFAVRQQRHDPLIGLSGVILNVATVDTPQERLIRPGVKADEQARWLKPQQVIERSKDLITLTKPGTYTETDIFNPWSGFSPNIYRDTPAARSRWRAQLKKPLEVTPP